MVSLLSMSMGKLTTAAAIPGGGGTGSGAVALDTPITAALKSSTQLVFGLDRWVDGFIGNTVRLQRSSDNVQADFKVDPATGILDLDGSVSGVRVWAGSSTVTVVQFYDQMLTGKILVAVGSVVFMVNGVVQRFGTDWSTVDGQLTRSTTKGGVGCLVTGGAYFTLASSGLTLASGMEVHMLASPLARKKATATVDPAALGATTTSEQAFSYGTATTNNFRYAFGGAAASSVVSRNGTAAGGSSQTVTVGPILKKNSQFVHSTRCDATEISFYAFGRKVSTAATSAGNVTANASMSNGQFRVGEGYGTGTPGNMLFGGVAITNTLADRDRSWIHATANAIGQQHQRRNWADLSAEAIDEIIDFRDVDANGLVVGRKGKTSIQFNKTVGAPSFNFSYTTPQGWTGIRSPSTNADNTYRATNNYLADVQSCSMMTVGVNENTNLNQTFSVRSDTDTSNFSLGMGRHHTTPNVQRRISSARDTQSWTSHLYSADGGDAGGGVLSQGMCKYQYNLINGEWTPGDTTSADIVSQLYGVTIPSGSVLTTALAATVGWFPPVPEEQQFASEADLKFTVTAGELLYHIATILKGPNYNPTDPEATRRNFMRTGTNRSYVGHPGSPLGHRDGSIAIENGTGSIAESDSNFRIQSNAHQGDPYQGTLSRWLFSKSQWTPDQAEQLQVNLYKTEFFAY